MDGSRFSRRGIAAPLLATLLALLMAPAGAQAQSEAVVTINDPAGTRVVTPAELDRWTTIASKFDERKTPQRTLRASALQILTRGHWLEAEAGQRGIVVTDVEVQKVVDEFLGGSDELAELRRWIRASGITREEFTFLVRTGMVSVAIFEQEVERLSVSVTDSAVDAYIQKHGPMREPERRDVRVVVTETRADAERARWALDHGATWSQVAFDYSIGKSRRSARTQKRVPKDAFEPGVGRAVFRTREGRLVGPIKARSGYFVVKVVRIRPQSVLPERQHRAAVRGLLAGEATEQALETFSTAFLATWKARTVCAPSYVWYVDCSNWDGTQIKGLDGDALPTRMLAAAR